MVHEQNGNISKEIGNIKRIKKKFGTECTITNEKKSLEGFKSRFEQT